ncbi:uncharacterized protein TNIN_209811, partial [Trichonephila inaurata madagascariensis]
NFKSIVAPDENGFPNLCVAIESLWGQPDTKEEQIPVTTETGSCCNQRVTTRLPSPYNTNCTDYLRLWRQNGGQGPLTERSSNVISLQACADKCKMDMMIEIYGCVGQSIPYPNNNSVCEDSSLYPSLEILKKCSKQCSEACEKRYLNLNFIFNRLEIEKFAHEAKYESVSMFSYIGGLHGHVVRDISDISLRFLETLRVTTRLPSPYNTNCTDYLRLQGQNGGKGPLTERSVSMFSYIGGYMGMWLGISLISLFDFLETLVSLCIYTLRNSKKFKKKSIQRSFDI